MISTEQIKSLREKTGISIGECKKALEEALGDESKALEILQARSVVMANKKSDRELGAGSVASYIHGGTVGVLVDVRCETDFVSKNPDFKSMVEDIAMHVAAMVPEDIQDLASQPFIKDGEKTVDDIIKQASQKFGERVEIMRFVRFDISE